jgi:phospholipid/cholesterol/gamma-HCH transport system ATP-binding protein
MEETAVETRAIDVEDLGITFDEKEVLRGINLGVEKGRTHVVMGKNGSGKSVLLKAIAGLIDHFQGTIRIYGQEVLDFFADRDREKKDKEKEDEVRLAYVFQKGGLFDSMNLYDNVAFGLRRMGIGEEEVRERVQSSLTRVGLKGNDEKLPSELSGGMQKRAGLARAVCLRPDIILFDDPTAGLDPILSDSIADLVLEIRDEMETTSIIATHDMSVAAKVGHRVSLLYGGEIVFNGSMEDFTRQEDPYARQFAEGDIEGPIDMF